MHVFITDSISWELLFPQTRNEKIRTFLYRPSSGSSLGSAGEFGVPNSAFGIGLALLFLVCWFGLGNTASARTAVFFILFVWNQRHKMGGLRIKLTDFPIPDCLLPERHCPVSYSGKLLRKTYLG
jgi:hypothetical protein